MAVSLETKVKEILENPKYKAILDKVVPGVSGNPLLAMAKGMKLSEVLKNPAAKGAGLTEDKLKSFIDMCNK
jgi:hypothetical protein